MDDGAAVQPAFQHSITLLLRSTSGNPLFLGQWSADGSGEKMISWMEGFLCSAKVKMRMMVMTLESQHGNVSIRVASNYLTGHIPISPTWILSLRGSWNLH